MADELKLEVNAETHAVTVSPETPLLYVLMNDLGLLGPRFGCGLGAVRRLLRARRRRGDAIVHHADLRGGRVSR